MKRSFRTDRGGIWFADLTAVTSDSEVPNAITKAVGLALRDGDLIAQIVEYLADKAALVVLDNCEHVSRRALGSPTGS